MNHRPQHWTGKKAMVGIIVFGLLSILTSTLILLAVGAVSYKLLAIACVPFATMVWLLKRILGGVNV